MNTISTPGNNNDTLFLPDFCNIRVVFSIIIIAELLAFVLTLGLQTQVKDLWSYLGFVSLFIQWVALTSTAILCVSRPYLTKLSTPIVGLVCCLLVLVITAVLSKTALLITQGTVLEWLLPAQSETGFLLRNIAISAIVSAVALRYFYIQHQLKANIEAEARARIQALQARIRPHFLFNCMNVIASLTRSQPALAEEVVEDLAELFRASLTEKHNIVKIGEEVDLSKRYLHIEKLRLGDRLNTNWNINPIPHDATLPVLTLQPLIENAIMHGIEPFPDNGVINITGSKKGELIEIIIDNPVPDQQASGQRTGNQIAMDNIQQRLEAYYGIQGKLIVNQQGHRYEVRLIFPYQPTNITKAGTL